MIRRAMTAKSQAAPSHPLPHVDDYLSIGQEAGASDIHLGVNAPPIWRLHGILRAIWPDAPRFTAEQTNALAAGFLGGWQRAQLEERGDSDFSYTQFFCLVFCAGVSRPP